MLLLHSFSMTYGVSILIVMHISGYLPFFLKKKDHRVQKYAYHYIFTYGTCTFIEAFLTADEYLTRATESSSDSFKQSRNPG